MNRLLLIVDPQVDFITGTLPVPGAEDAMNLLAEFIARNDGRYIHKIVTADCHPFNHFSFADCGGRWPRHCVRDTVGAAVWTPLVDPLYQTFGDVTVLYKGQHPSVEEYSIFRNVEAAARISTLVGHLAIERIDICGLAGDVCVNDTLRDGVEMFGPGIFNLLRAFTPSLDGGEKLNATIKEYRIQCDR